MSELPEDEIFETGALQDEDATEEEVLEGLDAEEEK